MKTEDTEQRLRTPVVLKKLILVVSVHLIAIRALFLLHKLHVGTLLYGALCYQLAGLGITAGAHRLWSHRSYKAKLPLRIFLALMSCAAWQIPILQWARDHRTHHKFTDTDADPHNATRGLFFSHFGSIICQKHDDVVTKGKTISVDDLLADPVVRIQKRFFIPGALFMCIILPTWIPYYCWNESLLNSYYATVLRYCLTMNAAFAVNSFAHWAGSKPYDRTITPADNEVVAMITMGEGFHNYPHAFPQDYSTSELGIKWNPTKVFIDVMAYLGQVYDRKSTPKHHIEARKNRNAKSAHQH